MSSAEQKLAIISVALGKQIHEVGLHTGTFEFEVWSALYGDEAVEVIPPYPTPSRQAIQDVLIRRGMPIMQIRQATQALIEMGVRDE